MSRQTARRIRTLAALATDRRAPRVVREQAREQLARVKREVEQQA